MGLPKGKTNNIAGRPVGALNKLTKDLRKEIADFLQENFYSVKTEWGKMEGKDKIQFYKELLQYSIPKMANIEMKSEFTTLTDENLEKIINELKK